MIPSTPRDVAAHVLDDLAPGMMAEADKRVAAGTHLWVIDEEAPGLVVGLFSPDTGKVEIIVYFDEHDFEGGEDF
jgi:hypothetical protein